MGPTAGHRDTGHLETISQSRRRPLLQCLQCESGSSRFQLGEGPSRGLLRDCTTSTMDRFAALVDTGVSRVAAPQCPVSPLCRVSAPPSPSGLHSGESLSPGHCHHCHLGPANTIFSNWSTSRATHHLGNTPPP